MDGGTASVYAPRAWAAFLEFEAERPAPPQRRVRDAETIAWFDELGLTDTATRRRQGRQPGRADPGRTPGPARLRGHRRRLPAGHGRGRRPRRAADAVRRGVQPSTTRGSPTRPSGCRRWCARRASRRGGGRRARRLPPAGRGRAGRRALVGHGRGRRRHLVRRDARDLHQRGRRRRAAGTARRLLGLAVRRAGHRLPGQPGLTEEPAHRSRRPADGGLRAGGRALHRRPVDRRPRPDRDRRRLRAGRGRGRRARSSPTPTCVEGRPAPAVGARRPQDPQDRRRPGRRRHRASSSTAARRTHGC